MSIYTWTKSYGVQCTEIDKTESQSTGTNLADVDSSPANQELVELRFDFELSSVRVDLTVFNQLQKLLLGILNVLLGTSDYHLSANSSN